MRTVARITFAATALLGAARLVGAADVGTDRAGAIAAFPLIQVQTAAGKDTVLELASTSASSPLTAWCHFQNANAHCSNNPSIVCETAADCGGFPCDPGWSISDFRVDLTPPGSVSP